MTEDTSKHDEEGTITVILQRLVKKRIPRVLELKAYVDNGGCLSDLDIEFLERAFNDYDEARRHIHLKDHPELAEIASKMAGLYEEITTKAVANELHKNN